MKCGACLALKVVNMSDSDPVIRRACPDDLQSIMFGLKALAADLGDPFNATQETIRESLFGPAAHSQALLATGSPITLGIALCSPLVSTTLGCSCIYVSDLWVEQTARGQSLGRQLLATAAREGRLRWQANAIVLNIYEENSSARDFYEHLGFKIHNRERRAALTGAALRSLDIQDNDESLL